MRRAPARVALAVLWGVSGVPVAGSAQEGPLARAPGAGFSGWESEAAAGPASWTPGPRASPSWAPPLASVALPGAGQLLRGERRGWLYLAAEGVVWTGWGVERARGRDDRGRYRDLAWEVARDGTTPRIEGDFEYYERMARWPRSGAFDADPAAPGIQPETDPTTFNGDAWSLALDIFAGNGAPPAPGDPAYAAALAFYVDRAYAEGFLWDWTGDSAAQERFGDLIRRSDDHFRQASLWFGGAILNRVVSALDAVLSAHTPARVSTVLERMPGAVGPRHTFRLHIRIP